MQLMQRKNERGSQAVEFALVLPFLLIVIFLVIDFAFLLYDKAVITNASREAARAGTVLSATPWSTTSVAAVACTYVTGALISMKSGTKTASCNGTADPVITVSNPNGNVPPAFGDPVTVQISYTYSGFLNTATGWISVAPWSLTAASTMNHE
ncbi:TadE/TadG family type IV pilus assembly protein [Herbaspirillum sp.]|uniref:TadE/TadG family type IV pilus assembly protein n=1 Tax=Herbaspirillum sp. TaxID=1890675 RepID=UPI001AFD740B|nr:TadE/TadG family type IV pilus assembly protein [Herbaspirillum sp.]MBO9537642.1 pilus assembly protein [Herbaspirillum sp.]